MENEGASICTKTGFLDHSTNLQFLPVTSETNILKVQETGTGLKMEDIVAKQSRGLGVIAASHLEHMVRLHAPILCKEFILNRHLEYGSRDEPVWDKRFGFLTPFLISFIP
jgi:hypothetical protein